MGHAVYIVIHARDCPGVIDGVGIGAVEIARCRIRTGRLEARELAFGTADKTVEHVVRIQVIPGDGTPVVDDDRAVGIGETARALATGLARAGSIKGDEARLVCARRESHPSAQNPK
jgi:hypothetical protein